jgi:formylglycine-generating enzyme required for sulfatase activity
MAEGLLFGRVSVRDAVWAAICGGILVAANAEARLPRDGSAASEQAAASCPVGMVAIPAGTYAMGSESGKPDEKPVHQVTVAAFCIDRTEVTVAAYAQCVRAGACAPAPTTADWPGIDPEAKAIDSQFCNGAREDRQDHPINCVDWTHADAFCRSVGKRLPTEEEWEYAARGQDGRLYPWGGAAPNGELLNTLDTECAAMGARLGHPGWEPMFDGSDGWESTAPVGSYPKGASPFGVLDMAGNVWELTASGYSPDYASERASSDEKRVYRGGGWGFGDTSLIRTTNRGGSGSSPTYRGADLGFRCARTP